MMKTDSKKKEGISTRIYIDDHGYLKKKAFKSRSTIIDTLSNIINSMKSEIDDICIPQYERSKTKVKTKSVLIHVEDHDFLREVAFQRDSKIIEVVKILIAEYKKRENDQ
ncbi:hypothetical protein P4U97_01145 [Bacillus swezeyi]|uniref:hypothetical protein n=1 Tax=Bacillus swezeyi TaxID=1925020 RepID=UPI002E1E27D6|nr:hypothetical protein [Bacillus swezeyi]